MISIDAPRINVICVSGRRPLSRRAQRQARKNALDTRYQRRLANDQTTSAESKALARPEAWRVRAQIGKAAEGRDATAARMLARQVIKAFTRDENVGVGAAASAS